MLLSVITGCNNTSNTETEPTAGKETVQTITETEKGNIEDPSKSFKVNVKDISKHGNVTLNTTFTELNSNGIEVGDIITVQVGENEYTIPVGTSFSDVDSGNMVCRFDLEDNEVAIAINMGSFAKEANVGEKITIEEEPGYRWDIKYFEITLTLKEKGGYLDEYKVRNLVRTNERSDYATLSDEEFANFREINVSGLKEKTLYRSSTPIEPAIGRNEYAMKATENSGIKSIINLDDSIEVMKGYDTFENSYYSNCSIINPEMNYDFGTKEFGEKVKSSIVFIIENDGPYLIHCKEGKDRTGILCAILECFVGASVEDIINDYMVTYYNFYNVKPKDSTYTIISENNLVKTLCSLYEIENLNSADLKKETTDYLLSIGLSQEQLHSLESIISK